MTTISSHFSGAFLSVPKLFRSGVATTRPRLVFRQVTMSSAVKEQQASESNNLSKSTSFSTQPTAENPQGAVSTVVRCQPTGMEPKYMLVQRGKAPHKGMWALPGGRIEFGEPAVVAAKRELSEETTGWPTEAGRPPSSSSDNGGLQWHPHPFTTSDAIAEGYHYLISQCFANYSLTEDVSEWPVLQPADDAAAVDWFSLSQIETNDGRNISGGVFRVVKRAEDLYQHGVLGE